MAHLGATSEGLNLHIQDITLPQLIGLGKVPIHLREMEMLTDIGK